MSAEELVAALYMAFGVSMIVLAYVRGHNHHWFLFIMALLWTSLVFRLGLRQLETFAGHDLGRTGDIVGNQHIVAGQIAILTVATFVLALVEWEDG